MPLRHEDSKFHKEKIIPISIQEEAVGKAIVNAALLFIKNLDPDCLKKSMRFVFAMYWLKMGTMRSGN
jgi:hypothetical protein